MGNQVKGVKMKFVMLLLQMVIKGVTQELIIRILLHQGKLIIINPLKGMIRQGIILLHFQMIKLKQNYFHLIYLIIIIFLNQQMMILRKKRFQNLIWQEIQIYFYYYICFMISIISWLNQLKIIFLILQVLLIQNLLIFFIHLQQLLYLLRKLKMIQKYQQLQLYRFYQFYEYNLLNVQGNHN